MVHSIDILTSYLKHLSPLQGYFLKISRSSDDKKRKGGQEEGDVVEVDEMVEVDEKR